MNVQVFSLCQYQQTEDVFQIKKLLSEAEYMQPLVSRKQLYLYKSIKYFFSFNSFIAPILKNTSSSSSKLVVKTFISNKHKIK